MAVFLCFFALLCLLYGGTRHAGWAYDSIAWLQIVRNLSFIQHLNYAHHNGLSHYQLTQFVIWCMYRAFGTYGPAYLICHISLQAFNASLLFRITDSLLRSVNSRFPAPVALLAAAIFCLSPYASEVIVYKAAFHYAFALALLLSICWLCIIYLKKQQSSIAIGAALLYVLSLFSLELSYLTPWFCLAVIVWHGRAGLVTRRGTKTALIRFWLPQATLLGTLQLTNFLTRPEAGLSLLHRPVTFLAIKPPLFVLHLLFGRFLPQGWRDAWRDALCTYAGAGLFYLTLAILAVVSYRKLRRLSAEGKVAALAFAWLIPAMGLSALMWFPERDFIYCDRYLYPMIPAAALLLSCGIGALRNPVFRKLAGIAIVGVSIGCLLFNNELWRKSARVVHRLQAQAASLSGGRRILLLNSPWSFKGAPMIFPGAEAGFAAIDEARYGNRIDQPVDDVMSFNMRRVQDGAHVRVLDDSTVLVTLSQPGDWVRDYDPAVSYETPFYSAVLTGTGSYLLRLRARDLRLWYMAGDTLRIVDMNVRDRDQR